jgi:ribosomal protein L20
MNGLIKNNIAINRKILSELAISDTSTFEKIVQTAVK